MKKTFYLTFLAMLTLVEFSYAANNVKIWGQGLYIEENVYDHDNRYLRLNDGSFWLLNYTYESFWDRFSGKDVQSQWLAPQKNEVRYSSNHKYPYLMINIDTNESVEARQINPSLLVYTTLERFRSSVSSGLSEVASSSRSSTSDHTRRP